MRYMFFYPLIHRRCRSLSSPFGICLAGDGPRAIPALISGVGRRSAAGQLAFVCGSMPSGGMPPTSAPAIPARRFWVEKFGYAELWRINTVKMGTVTCANAIIHSRLFDRAANFLSIPPRSLLGR